VLFKIINPLQIFFYHTPPQAQIPLKTLTKCKRHFKIISIKEAIL